MSETAIAVVLLGAAVVIAAGILRAVAKRRVARQEAIAKLGLEPLELLDPTLAERILELYKPPQTNPEVKTKWSIVRVLRYTDPAADCYFLTVQCEKTEWIWARGGHAVRAQTTEERIVALLAHGWLNAPRIDILPKTVSLDPGAGRLAAAIVRGGNAILEDLGESDPDRIKFPDDPEFERRYYVRALLANPARNFLDATRRRALLELDGERISLDGSMLLVTSWVDRIKHRGQPLAERLAAELAQAKQVLAIFSSSG